MPERDGYIAGVPCWVDTSQPDPDAAAEFYGGLFGWEFEDAMPAGSPGRYLIARLRGGEVAAVSSPPEGAPPQAVWNTYIWVEDADECGGEGARGGRQRAERAVRRDGRGPDGGARRPGGSRVLRLAGEGAQGRADRERAGLAELQRPQHPRSGGCEAVLRRSSSAGRRSISATVSSGRCARTATTSSSSHRGRASERRSLAPRVSRTWWRRSHRSPAMTPTRPPIGASRSRPTTPTRRRRRRPSSAAPCSSLRSTHRTRDSTVLRDPQGATFSATAFVPENKDVGRAAA